VNYLKLFLVLLLTIPQTGLQAYSQSFEYNEVSFRNYLRSENSYSHASWLNASQTLWQDNPVLQQRVNANGHDNVGRAMGGYSVSSISESGKAIVIIMALHVAALVKSEARKRDMMGLDPEGPEWRELISDAAVATVNNFEFYTGGVGVFATGISLAGGGAAIRQVDDIKAALDVLQQRVADSPAAKRHFLGLLKAGALSLIMFTVAEAGGQLWHEAVSMEGERVAEAEMSSEEVGQYMNAMNGLKMTEFIRGWFGGEQPSDLEKEIFSRLTMNMWTIITSDPDRRYQLFYNTWRKRIATADFWLMVVAMTAAGYTGAKAGMVVGAPLGPWGSAILAGIFGVVMVVVTGFVMMFVPQHTKDWANQRFRNARMWVNEGELESWFRNLENGLNLMATGWRENFGSLTRRSSMAINFLNKMSQTRQNMINVWIENYHLALQKKRFAEYENSIIALSSNPEFQRRIAELDAFQEDEEVPGTALNQFLEDHSSEVEGLMEQAQIDFSEEGRIEIAIENEAKILEATQQIEEGENFFATFYEQHAIRLSNLFHSRLYDTENYRIEDDIKEAFEEEFRKLSYLAPELRWLALGLNPNLADEHDGVIPTEVNEQLYASSIVKVNYYYDTMFHEARVIEARKVMEDRLDLN